MVTLRCTKKLSSIKRQTYIDAPKNDECKYYLKFKQKIDRSIQVFYSILTHRYVIHQNDWQ